MFCLRLAKVRLSKSSLVIELLRAPASEKPAANPVHGIFTASFWDKNNKTVQQNINNKWPSYLGSPHFLASGGLDAASVRFLSLLFGFPTFLLPRPSQPVWHFDPRVIIQRTRGKPFGDRVLPWLYRFNKGIAWETLWMSLLACRRPKEEKQQIGIGIKQHPII